MDHLQYKVGYAPIWSVATKIKPNELYDAQLLSFTWALKWAASFNYNKNLYKQQNKCMERIREIPIMKFQQN